MTELQLFPYDLFDPLPFQVAIGATARTVATEFSVTSGSWWLTEMRLWRNSWELTGPLQFRVYTVVSAASGTLLAGSDATLRTRGLGWQAVGLAVPVKLTTGQSYRVCCWAPRGVNYETGFWSAAVTNGALTAPSRATSVGTTQGAYKVGTSLAYPTTDGGSINWYVDVTVTDVDPATVISPATTALDSADQQPLAGLYADWGRDGYANALVNLSSTVAEITVNRSVTGDLPVEAGLIEGYAAAQLTATLHGTFADSAVDVFDVLAPSRTDSPLAAVTQVGTPVSCELGLATDAGPAMAQQFTGRVRSLRADSGQRTIDLSALDPAEQLRASISLPVYGMRRTTAIYPAKSQAVIDYILRANGIYASPPSYPGAQISCTGHGWLAAEIGASSIPSGGPSPLVNPPFWVPGPFDMLAVRGDWLSPIIQTFFAKDPGSGLSTGSGIGVSAWVRVGSDLGQTAANLRQLVLLNPLAGGSGPSLDVRVYGNGRIAGYIDTVGSIRTISTPMQWRYIGVHFAFLAGSVTRISIRVDGVTTTTDVTTPAITGTGIYAQYMSAVVSSAIDWSNLSIWYSPTAPSTWTGEIHTSQASLDAGRNELTHIPDVTNVDSWNLIQEVAGAELGLVGFDEYGVFYFRERADLVAVPNAPVITADRGLLACAASTDIDGLRNIVAAKVSAAEPIDQTTSLVFEADRVDQFDSPIGTTAYYVLLPWGVAGTASDRFEVPRQDVSVNWNDPTLISGYVPVRADSPSTELANLSIRVWWNVLPGGRFGKLTVVNSSAFSARLAHPTTLEPALRIEGYQFVLGPTQTVQATDAVSVAADGPRALSLSESAWRQLPSPIQTLTTALVGTLARERPVFEVSALGDPRRRVGDTVTISDPGGQGIITGLIVSITRRYSDRGLIDDLTVRTAT